ncbi:hypothetical protein E3Q13_01054 [Wallemia mellicola]|nr:hypothetical protein E3Q13_01054 [Wallemia mellicola]TIC56352.1 hypothetical protein E3Q04_01013 [Wallemia mellicola]
MTSQNYTSDAIESRVTPGAGIGVFSKRQLEADEKLYQTNDEYFSVIYRRYWKEVCASCYNYDRGIDWKVKENNIGLAFCTEDCRNTFMSKLDDDMRVFLAKVEEYARKRKQVRDFPDLEDDIIPDKRIIEESWNDSQHTLLDIVDVINSEKINKRQRKFINEIQAAGLQAYDEDSEADIDSIKNLTSYILTNIQSPSTVAQTLELSTTLEPYTLSRMLDQQVNHYLAIVTLLPPSLSRFALAAPSIAKILAVDRSNSFGIWSGSSDKASAQSEERSELLGSMLVPSLSRFNHSCSPTVSKSRYRKTWTFSTTNTVNKDSELFITYLGGDESMLKVEDRRQRLMNGWGFVCGCSKCTKESNKSD